MDLKEKGRSVSPDRSCSICLDPVVDRTGARSVARLHCGHDFHLDCIGSAFNAKGKMQCPNCRKIEKGQWLYANGLNHQHPPTELDFEFIGEEIYDLALPELPIIHWCPFRGFTQLTSIYEEPESQPYQYYDLFGTNSTMGAELAVGSSSTSTQHDCPYLAQHSMHAPSSSSGPIDSNVMQYRQMSSLPSSSEQQQQPFVNMFSNPVSYISPADQSHYSSSRSHHHRNNRADSPAQQQRGGANGGGRNGQYVHHPVPVFHGPGSQARNSGNQPMVPPQSHSNHHNHSRTTPTNTNNSSQIYQNTLRTNPPLVPVPVSMRRVRPRGVTFFSSVSTGATAATSSNSEIGGFYGFALGSRSTEGEGVPGRHMDRVYGPGPGREVGNQQHLPWIPLEGENQWWAPFNPMGSQIGGLFGPQQQRVNGEDNRRDNNINIGQRRESNSNNNNSNSGGGYQHMPAQHHRPPYM